jgi:hypothetical protein
MILRYTNSYKACCSWRDWSGALLLPLSMTREVLVERKGRKGIWYGQPRRLPCKATHFDMSNTSSNLSLYIHILGPPTSSHSFSFLLFHRGWKFCVVLATCPSCTFKFCRGCGSWHEVRRRNSTTRFMEGTWASIKWVWVVFLWPVTLFRVLVTTPAERKSGHKTVTNAEKKMAERTWGFFVSF